MYADDVVLYVHTLKNQEVVKNLMSALMSALCCGRKLYHCNQTGVSETEQRIYRPNSQSLYSKITINRKNTKKKNTTRTYYNNKGHICLNKNTLNVIGGRLTSPK